MSGRERKQPNRGGQARRPQPAAKYGGSSRTATATAPAQRRQQPVADVRSHRTWDPSSRSAGEERRQQAERRKRNQRFGVVVGAVALGGAAIGGVIAGKAGGAEPTDGTSVVSSSPAAPSGTEPAAETTAPAGLAISCPTDAGASPDFGHDIAVPEPYTITITYGDGDEYTDDSSQLGAIFSHTYAEPGTYTVNAVLTLPEGTTTSATCDYTWGP